MRGNPGEVVRREEAAIESSNPMAGSPCRRRKRRVRAPVALHTQPQASRSSRWAKLPGVPGLFVVAAVKAPRAPSGIPGS